MTYPDLNRLDLNSLRLLKALVETGNTLAAAERLNISQASVSRGLARLRECFGERLFIRHAHGLKPSQLALELANSPDLMEAHIAEVLSRYQAFDPTSYSGRVRLAVHSLVLDVMADSLVTELTRVLPQAQIQLESWSSESMELLLTGDIHFALQLETYPLPQDLYCKSLATVENTLVLRRDHPLLATDICWENLEAYPLVLLMIPGYNEHRAAIEDEYKRRGYQAGIRLRTTSTSAAIHYLEHSDALMVGSRYVSTLSPGLTTCQLPKVAEPHRQIRLLGICLQTRRDHPLQQCLESTMEQALKPLN